VKVQLTVQRYVQITPKGLVDPETGKPTITMTPIDSSDFYNGIKKGSSGSMLIEVINTYDGTLQCLNTAKLTNGAAEKTVDAAVSLSGGGTGTSGNTGGYYWVALSAGEHLGLSAVTLSVSLEKEYWTAEDLAGDYTGEVILEFIP